jgi:broad specificity phosphatase PhoE
METSNSPAAIGWVGHLTLVRHGQTRYNAEGRFIGTTDLPLDRTGVDQARAVADWVVNLANANGVKYDAIISSPLQRARQTAAEFARRLLLPVSIEPQLIERDYGKFEGLTRDQAKAKYGDILDQYEAAKHKVTPPGGESIASVEHRVRAFLHERLAKRYTSAKEIIIVTHLNGIRAFFHILGLADWEVYGRPFNNMSVSRIRISETGCTFEFCDENAGPT